MTRAEVNQILRQMEHCRHLQMEAESVRESRRLSADYDRMWNAIRPYVEGKRPYLDDRK